MEPESSSQFGRKKYLDAMRIILVGDEEYLITEQITKTDRDACHALCRESKARATLRRLSSTVLRTINNTRNQEVSLFRSYLQFK